MILKLIPAEPVKRFSAAIFFLLLIGCSSPRSNPQISDTAVLILNRTPDEISAVVNETFKRHQYESAHPSAGLLVFEKRGTFVNDLMSPNWFDGPTWLRVKVFQHQLDTERTVLDYSAYVVQQPEDPFFQTEHRYGGHKKEFEALMQEISQSLNRSRNQARQ